MSTKSEQPNTDQQPNKLRLNRIEFYRACQELSKRAEEFLAAEPTNVVAARMLTKYLGFRVPDVTIPELKEATGVQWEGKRVTNPARHKSKKERQNVRMKVVVSALVRLYRKLSEEVPSELAAAWEEMKKGHLNNPLPGEENGQPKD